jgi:hypothetical protein
MSALHTTGNLPAEFFTGWLNFATLVEGSGNPLANQIFETATAQLL